MKLILADMSAMACDTFLQVQYAEKDHLPLHLQIIQPRVAEGDTTTLFPLIVFVQGSAWLKQNCGRDLTQLASFAKRGYVVAIVEYRPAYAAPFPAQIKDANTAVRFLVENGKAYHADCNNIFMWGTSSGAHTVNMVNVTWNDPDFTDEKDEVWPPIKAFIDYYGPSDITRIQSETPTYEYLTKKMPEGILLGDVPADKIPEAVAKANPINYLKPGFKVKPTLIIHGSKDRQCPFLQSVLYYNALKETGNDVECYQLKLADHGGAAFWTDDILNIVERFIRRNLKQ